MEDVCPSSPQRSSLKKSKRKQKRPEDDLVAEFMAFEANSCNWSQLSAYSDDEEKQSGESLIDLWLDCRGIFKALVADVKREYFQNKKSVINSEIYRDQMNRNHMYSSQGSLEKNAPTGEGSPIIDSLICGSASKLVSRRFNSSQFLSELEVGKLSLYGSQRNNEIKKEYKASKFGAAKPEETKCIA